MDNNSHKSFKDCSTAAVGRFISLLHGSGKYKRVSYYPVDEKSHFERFGYICGDDKISVVYDTKAKILSLTAREEQMNILSQVYEKGEFPASAFLPQVKQKEKNLPRKQPDKPKEKLPAKQEKPKQNLPQQQSDKRQKLPATQNARNKEQQKQIKPQAKQGNNKPAAAPLAKSNKQSQAAEKKLKKLLPCAYEYLSYLAKNDFTSAMTDIYNDEIRLTDYSGLLVSPYRGLERLIYDLQTAEGIRVKMIGQAYEKRADGSYCLKSGYRKRIKSIVYNEVMSALYTEYFEKRNFYLHSNNSLSSESRVIDSMEEARKIFDNLLTIVEYNCEKLREIRFSVKPVEQN